MTIQFVPIQVPRELREELQMKKGNKTYQKFIQDLMNKREGHLRESEPSQAPSEELTNG